MTNSREQLENLGFEPSLHRQWYVDPAYFEREREDIFTREWICVGRDEDLPSPGDHRVLDLHGESILLVRNREGALRAFYNVCRHRGARLCGADDGDGVLRGGVTRNGLIRCPYHAWSYDLDGRLVNAPHMEAQDAFRPDGIELFPVGAETWGGFVFLNLSPDGAPDFDARIAPVAERLKRYPLASLRSGHEIEYDVGANWKVLCENYNECYHCGPVHPELCSVVPAYRANGGANLDWDAGIPHREGATTFTASGETSRRSFPGLDQDEQVRHKGELVLPNLFISLSRDHVAAFILDALGFDRTRIRCLWLFEPHEIEQPDFDPSDAVGFWDLVNRQDWAICERVQQGMAARVFDYGALSPMEDWSLDVRQYVTERTGLTESG